MRKNGKHLQHAILWMLTKTILYPIISKKLVHVISIAGCCDL